MKDVIRHYDLLIEEDNDPVLDPAPLRAYMDGWDGPLFLAQMALDKTQHVLEIGVGTGRIALRVAPLCAAFFGIDLSPKTVARAREHLAAYSNAAVVCGDFLTYEFPRCYDVVYSTLTFLHIKEKCAAIAKTARLLCDGGLFVLSVGKDRGEWLDMGTRRLRVYPDDPDALARCMTHEGLAVVRRLETEQAYLLVARK